MKDRLLGYLDAKTNFIWWRLQEYFLEPQDGWEAAWQEAARERGFWRHMTGR